jgi:hypothetical protein
MSEYGFNERTGEFNSNLFAATKTDAQIDGVRQTEP